METRPAPLDGLNHDCALDEFSVSAPREIQTLLRQLHDGSVLLNLNASDGSVFTSAIWTIDSSRGTIGFNADPADPAMQTLLECDEADGRGLPRQREAAIRRARPGAGARQQGERAVLPGAEGDVPLPAAQRLPGAADDPHQPDRAPGPPRDAGQASWRCG